ncbi:MAG: OmpA family protein [Betaproteobacteria bacterium]|nr:OmpA family protein [Betaproteobacteria bacterium]
MKSFLRIALIISLFALGSSALAAGGSKKGYLVDSQNDVVRSGFGLCWHTGFWTPADAIEECDGAISKPAAAAPAPSPAPAPTQKLAAEPEPDAVVYAEEETVLAEDEPDMPAPAPAAAAAAAPTAEKVTFSADAFFDFDKSVLKPEGKTTLQNLVAQLKNTDIEVVVATGHTDWTGSDAYNMKLSMRRAKAVKAFLVSRGIPEARVFVEGKGERNPIADNHTKDGRAKNRRVDIEVVGTKK